MHSYIRARNNGETSYVVGHWLARTWQPVANFTTETEAASYTSFLNGGEHPEKPWPAGVER